MTLKNLQQEAYKVRMTPEEKAAMRAQIFGAPSSVATHTASPYFFFDFQFMTRALAAVLVVVMVGGTGVAYAAEGSLPGEAFYAVKVNVTEPIKTALAPNPAARAAVHVELAQRRVEEAEALAVKGALDATTTAELENNFESHVQSADELATEVGATDPSGAVEIKAELASSLEVHGALLASLAGEDKSGSSKNNSEQLASRVIARANVAAGVNNAAPRARTLAMAVPTAAKVAPQAKSQAVSTFSASAPSEVATATTIAATTPAPTEDSSAGAGVTEDSRNNENTTQDNELKVRAESALAKAKDIYDNRKSKLDDDARNSLDKQFAEVEADIDAGNYADALKLALKLQVVIKAQSKYRTNIITPLFKLQLGVDLNDNRRGQDGSGDSSDSH